MCSFDLGVLVAFVWVIVVGHVRLSWFGCRCISSLPYFITFTMEILSQQQKIEMILIYGESGRNINDALTLYAQRFPESVPSRASFYRVVRNFITDGSVQPKKRKRQVTVTGVDKEIAILAAVTHDPHVSTRQLSRDSGMSLSSVWKVLKRNNYHPYHISLHQELHGNDFENRVTFCQWAVQQIQGNPNFFYLVLFTDESSFTNHGNVNRHNMHYWSVENPHWLREVEHQRPWSVNVWCGIIGDQLIGPYFIDGNLNGEKYRNFLENQLPILLEDLSLEVRHNMWFQHDGCPAHYAVIAREVLNREFNGRWIGRGGPVNWPARSPDLTAPDFYLWGYLKNRVYQEVPTTRDNMIERIRSACAQISPDTIRSCVESFKARINKCIEVRGHHFEHLL